jgi:hypothetical protein
MDKATPVRARCHAHPGVAAVAYCDVCGRALCLECAVPVRGEVVGTECLATVLPESSPANHSPPPQPRRTIPDRVALGALALAAVATLLPWTQFGTGSRPFGAWGFSPLRHASAVGPLAAAAVLALWLASRPHAPWAERYRMAIAAGLGTLVVAFSFLALVHPAPFTRGNASPFLALTGGLVAALAWPVWARLRPDRSRTTDRLT